MCGVRKNANDDVFVIRIELRVSHVTLSPSVNKGFKKAPHTVKNAEVVRSSTKLISLVMDLLLKHNVHCFTTSLDKYRQRQYSATKLMLNYAMKHSFRVLLYNYNNCERIVLLLIELRYPPHFEIRISIKETIKNSNNLKLLVNRSLRQCEARRTQLLYFVRPLFLICLNSVVSA